MKTLLILAALAALTACGGGGGDPVPPTCTVDLYGDSIMVGSYAHVGGDAPEVLLKRMRPAYTINQRAVSGETAQRRLETFDGGDSRFVVLEFGSNDIEFGWPYEQPMRQLVRVAKAEGRQVIITGLSHHSQYMQVIADGNEIARRVAAEEGAIFADWYSVPFYGDLVDATHPNAAYTERLMSRLAETLDRVAPECAP